MHLDSLSAGRAFLREVARTGQTIGTVHTLGALHRGHAELIRRAAIENDVAIVTVYPNKSQFEPGVSYEFNLDDDIGLALRAGATAVLSSSDAEMFPAGYRTFLTQDDYDLRLDGPEEHLKEAVTGSIRWICYARPTRSYFGLKDIGQAILVKRAVADLLLDCEIRFVPTVRYRNGVPISSRLRRFSRSELDELSCLFMARSWKVPRIFGSICLRNRSRTILRGSSIRRHWRVADRLKSRRSSGIRSLSPLGSWS